MDTLTLAARKTSNGTSLSWTLRTVVSRTIRNPAIHVEQTLTRSWNGTWSFDDGHTYYEAQPAWAADLIERWTRYTKVQIHEQLQKHR